VLVHVCGRLLLQYSIDSLVWITEAFTEGSSQGIPQNIVVELGSLALQCTLRWPCNVRYVGPAMYVTLALQCTLRWPCIVRYVGPAM